MNDKTYTACVLVIGNEVLSGRTADANINFLGTALTALGIRLAECRVIADDETEIVAAVNHCRAKFDYVFTTGGIGSTHDDITASCIAKAFGRAYETHPQAERILLDHYGENANPARMRMAMMPKDAELIDNPVSIAPGFKVENVYVFAGVPLIARAMFDGVKGTLKGGAVMVSRTVSTTEFSEGMLADQLSAIQDNHPDLEIGSYPFIKHGGFGVNLVVRGSDAVLVDVACDALIAMLRDLGGDAIDGETHGEVPN